MSRAALLAHQPHPGLTPYGQAVKALSPSLYWALDEKTGALDLSGNERHGVGAGGITVGTFAASPISGETNCTEFDGANDRLVGPYVPYVNSTTKTFAGWAWRDTSAADQTLIASDDANNAPLLRLVAPTDVKWYSDSNTAGHSLSAVWPGDGQWVHWALVFDETGDLGTLYIAGSSVGTFGEADPYLGSPGNFQIGAVATFLPFDGKMAHVAVFETGLSAGNITTLADATP